MTRQEVIKKSREVATHEKVVAEYNKISPLPVGYKLKLPDDWCAAFVTVVMHLCGYDKLNECSVPRMIEKARDLNIWITSHDYIPQPGDLVVYDWDNIKDGDHIGIITDIDNSGYITVREGNKNNSIGLRVLKYSDSSITGYITPKYKKEAAAPDTYKTVDDIVNAIIKGSFGNGDKRKDMLYNYFQKKVNEKLS